MSTTSTPPLNMLPVVDSARCAMTAREELLLERVATMRAALKSTGVRSRLTLVKCPNLYKLAEPVVHHDHALVRLNANARNFLVDATVWFDRARGSDRSNRELLGARIRAAALSAGLVVEWSESDANAMTVRVPTTADYEVPSCG